MLVHSILLFVSLWITGIDGLDLICYLSTIINLWALMHGAYSKTSITHWWVDVKNRYILLERFEKLDIIRNYLYMSSEDEIEIWDSAYFPVLERVNGDDDDEINWWWNLLIIVRDIFLRFERDHRHLFLCSSYFLFSAMETSNLYSGLMRKQHLYCLQVKLWRMSKLHLWFLARDCPLGQKTGVVRFTEGPRFFLFWL